MSDQEVLDLMCARSPEEFRAGLEEQVRRARVEERMRCAQELDRFLLKARARHRGTSLVLLGEARDALLARRDREPDPDATRGAP